MLYLNNGDLVLNKLRVRSSTESSSTRSSTEIVGTEIVRQENLEKPLKSVTGIQKLRKIVKNKKFCRVTLRELPFIRTLLFVK